MTKLIIGMLVAAATFSSPERAQGQRGAQARIDTAVTLSRNGVVSVSLHGGRVRITGTTGREVTVRGTAQGGDLRVRARANSVSVASEGGWGHSRADLDISVPRGIRLSLEGYGASFEVVDVRGDVSAESYSGSLSVTGAAGKVRLEGMSGKVTAKDIEGDVTAESVSGAIEITGVSGDVTAESVSAPITITGARSRRVRAETLSAPVRYQGSLDPAGTYRFSSHSGMLTLVVPQNASASMNLETFSGSVRSDFPVTLEAQTNRRMGEKKFEFRVGDGRARVVLQTFSGQIRIQQAR